MKRPFLSALSIGSAAGKSSTPSSKKPPLPRSPSTPGSGVRIRVLLAAAGATVAVLLLYGGFVIWIELTAGETLARAEQLFSEEQPAAARESLDWLLWSNSGHSDALILLGRCWQAEQDLEAAAEAFGRVPVDSPRRDEALVLKAFSCLHLARFEEAEEILVDFLSRYPTHEEHPYAGSAHEELKWLYFNQLRNRELEEFLNASLRRQPASFRVLVDLLNTEFRRQVAQEGIGPLKLANEMEPGQAAVLLALGYCNWKLGDLTTALEQIQAAIELRPEHLETRFLAAEFLLEQGQLDSAEPLLMPSGDDSSSLRARFEKDDRWWWARSRLSQLRGNDELALEYLDEALAMRPHELKYVHRRGMLLQGLGKADEAAEAFSRMRQLEMCKSRLSVITRSGDLDSPTPELCLEVADLCEKRGREMQAAGWRFGAEQLRMQATMRRGAVPGGLGER